MVSEAQERSTVTENTIFILHVSVPVCAGSMADIGPPSTVHIPTSNGDDVTYWSEYFDFIDDGDWIRPTELIWRKIFDQLPAQNFHPYYHL